MSCFTTIIALSWQVSSILLLVLVVVEGLLLLLALSLGVEASGSAVTTGTKARLWYLTYFPMAAGSVQLEWKYLNLMKHLLGLLSKRDT